MGSLDEAQIAPGEPSEETLEQCVEIFSTFSNMDSLRIFMYAEKGISSSTKAIKDLGLTPKRFYSRLKGLVDAGILEKTGGSYGYTPVGEVLSRLGESIIGLVRNRERIELLLNLSRAEVLSSDERVKIKNLLVENSEVGEFLGPMMVGVTQPNIKKITEYDTLVKRLVEETDLSKKTMLLASKYFDSNVVDAILKANSRGVKVKVLMSKETMSKKMNKLRMMLSPRLIMSLLDLTDASQSISDTYREADIRFSFCIIDGYRCFFEFPSLMDEFSIAFHLDDAEISRKFTGFFERIWESSEKKEFNLLKK